MENAYNKKRGVFIYTLLFTYLITVCISLIAELTKVDFFKLGKSVFENYSISYVIQSVILASIPTTITFTGTVLLFQSNQKVGGISNTFILISISLISVIYIVIAQLENTNVILIIVSIILTATALVCSYISSTVIGTSKQSLRRNNCKIEKNDCCISR